MTYAWFMVAITFLTQFLAMGFTFYTFGIFLVPIQQEFDVGRTEVSLIPVTMSVAGAFLAPFIGRWVGKGSIRNIMTVGALAMGVGFLVGAHATALWQLLVLFGSLVTFSSATLGGVTSQALVVNWFKEDRTMALGISLMGISASGVVLPFVGTALLEAGGWRWAYEVFGWASLCLIPIVFLTVVGHPEERNGAAASESATPPAPPAAAPDFSTRDALRERNLWVIAITSGLSFMGTTAVMTQAFAYATDIGIEAGSAAAIMACLAAGAAAAKIGFGWLAARIGEMRALYIALAMQCVGTLGLNASTQLEPLLAVALVLGTGLGGVMPLAAALLAHAFGPARFGPMMGLMMPIMIPFQMIGAPVAAGVFDATGSYRMAWFGFTLIMLFAIGTLSLLRLDDEPQPQAA